MRIVRQSLLLFVGSFYQLVSQVTSEEVDFPPLLDSDDISYFFARNDFDGLSWALQSVLSRSERNPVAKEVVYRLPEQLVARGGGFTYTTAYKMQHDLEQAEYLADNLTDETKALFFRDAVAPAYRAMLERIPPLEELERTQGLYPFTSADREATQIDSFYNKALHQTNIDELKDDAGQSIPLINPNLDVTAIQRQWSGKDKDHGHPGIIVIDDVLSPPALAAIQKIMLESTVFSQCKLPKKFGGYVGAYIDDGLHDRILLELARELHDKLPEVFSGHALKYLWAYKYDSEYTGTSATTTF